MYVDEKKSGEAITDPFSLENLIAWLETKPRDEAYNWYSCRDCLAAQWIESVTGQVRFDFHRVVPHYLEIAGYGRHTFGAALTRARAIREQAR